MIDIKHDRSERRMEMEEYWEIKKEWPNAENVKIVNTFLLCMKNANKSKCMIISFRKKLQAFLREGKSPSRP